MDFSKALERLNRLKDLYKEDKLTEQEQEERGILYGELEEIITPLTEKRELEMSVHGNEKAFFSNYVSAGLLGSRTFFRSEGYKELLMVIGKVKRYAQDPDLPKFQQSITKVVEILNQFRGCCQYLEGEKLGSEKDVQNIVWIILRSHFDHLVREETLPKFGTKSFKPDFAIPQLRLLIEVKYIGKQTRIQDIQEEITADIPGYLNGNTAYNSVIVFIYDAAHKLKHDTSLRTALSEKIEGIQDILVVPGI